MEFVQHLASYLLLFHVLFPFAAGVLTLGLLSGSVRAAERWATVANLLLAVTSVLIVMALFQSASHEAAAPSVEVGWQLPLGTASSGWMNRVVWGVVPGTSIFLCLLPWILLSVQAFTPAADRTSGRTSLNLLLLGTLGLFIVGQDVGSLLSGAFLTVLLMAVQIARHGRENKRLSAGLFLTVQTVGLMLFMGGLAMFIASAAVVRSAPYGLPGFSSTVLPELVSIIQTAVHQHPAAEQLWGEYRSLPSFLVLCGIVLMGAGFPLQVWLSDVSASAALGERLWLGVWVKAVFLIGLQLLNQLDPNAMQDLGWRGLCIAIPGALFVSSLLFSQTSLSRLQSSGVAWTQQLALIMTFSAALQLEQWLVPLLLCQTAAILLWTIAVTTLSERFQSTEISLFRGLSAQAGWLFPVLIVCLLTMTLSPLGLGLMQAWLTTVTLLGSGTWGGVFLRLMFFLADLLALAGMVKVIRQLCTGPLRLPETAPSSWERTSFPAPSPTLTITSWQATLLFGWSALALAVAFLFPLNQILL